MSAETSTSCPRGRETASCGADWCYWEGCALRPALLLSLSIPRLGETLSLSQGPLGIASFFLTQNEGGRSVEY